MQVDRVLIIGQGSIGKRHLRLARTLLPNADIRVLQRQPAAVVPEYANGCFSSLEEAISHGPHIAVVASPASLHIAAAMPLVRAGVHLLVEKPLSSSRDGVAELLATVRERKVVLLIGYNLRYLPSLKRFRQLLAENFVGRILSVRCEVGQYLPSWRPDADYRHAVSGRRELGGGVLLEVSHELDYLRWIFGEVEWVTATLSRQSTLDIDVEDSAHLVMGFKRAADGRQLIGTVNMDFVRHDTTRVCTAIGETGSLRWNGLTGLVEKYEAGAGEWGEVFCHVDERDESYCEEWKHFLSCVDGQETPSIIGEDGLAVLNIVDAAIRSAASDCKAVT